MTAAGPPRPACLLGAALAGAALVLAFPPFDLWPLAALAPAPLCWIVTRPTLPRSTVLLSSVAFAATFYLGTVYWLVPVMRTFGGLHWTVAVMVLVPLLGFLAAFPVAFALAAHRLSRRLGVFPALLAAPVLWAALELGRNHLLTGFPWVRLGTAAHAAPALLQLASVLGVYGLSALLMAVAAALALAASGREHRAQASAFGGVVVGALLVTLLWGAARARDLDARAEAGERRSLRVACVQGNIPQDLKWDRRMASEILARHLRLTAEAAERGAALVVWPESSMPDALRTNSDFGGPVRELVARLGVPILLGSLDLRQGEAGERTIFNSAFLLGADGEIHGTYDKVHLVPFGEYVPWRWVFFFASSLVGEVGDLRPGASLEPLAGGSVGLPALGVQICYEILFPDLVRRQVAAGGELLINITNDAWFGRSSAPHQHFAEAVVRAVENGRWVVRAANTGVSGIISPSGRVVARSGLDEVRLLEGAVFARRDRTVYARIGDGFAWACAIITTVLLVLPGYSLPPPTPPG